ncbi:hypothetical protein MYAER_2027 [Microcystis aeruginosa NIES-2549]|uniref:Mobile element protein n=1 Tax=Microcystis aeruginosa NIES-2549 TaxID=1641812 RepID=A0A0F6RL51_MICAE|nr:hypothetical protein MYAER_2027 [Microcystis aeruginosa NIES-2549]
MLLIKWSDRNFLVYLKKCKLSSLTVDVILCGHLGEFLKAI